MVHKSRDKSKDWRERLAHKDLRYLHPCHEYCYALARIHP